MEVKNSRNMNTRNMKKYIKYPKYSVLYNA